MDSMVGFSRKLIFILLFMLCASTAFAQEGLNITDVDVTEIGTNPDSARMSVYFSLRRAQTPVADIKANDCSLMIDADSSKVIRSDIQKFVKGDKGVGVLFVFPIAKNYSEVTFEIRSTLINMLQMAWRPVDMVNAIPYEATGTAIGWSKASDASLLKALREMRDSDEILPNLFVTFNPAVAMLKSLENVSQKYLVIISDAEGELFNKPDQALMLIAKLADQLKQNNIIPIVIAYSPDGVEAMGNEHMIKRIATGANGAFFLADSLERFQSVMLNDVFDYIFKQYIYDVTLDLSGKGLTSGSHHLQLSVTHERGEEKAVYNVKWLELLKKSLSAHAQNCTKWWGCRALKGMK